MFHSRTVVLGQLIAAGHRASCSPHTGRKGMNAWPEGTPQPLPLWQQRVRAQRGRRSLLGMVGLRFKGHGASWNRNGRQSSVVAAVSSIAGKGGSRRLRGAGLKRGSARPQSSDPQVGSTRCRARRAVARPPTTGPSSQVACCVPLGGLAAVSSLALAQLLPRATLPRQRTVRDLLGFLPS